ncbi:MAG: VCBS repeat-containing protein [Flavobacteriales bacterium]|nr:VCBS repeat-containing protein [Flavobacteriales bacterium]
MKKFYNLIVCVLLTHQIYSQGGFTKHIDASNPITTFTSPGIYKGVSWIDFDNDNDLDLFASPNFLFRNDGNDVFVQIANPFSLTPLQNPGGSSWADINNDGFLDCIIAQNPSKIYFGNGDGSFTDQTPQYSSLSNYAAWGCAIGNWNNDAFPDFVFVHAAGFHGNGVGPYPANLYLNNSDNQAAQQITGYNLTDESNPYTVPYWSDYDLDGDMDLFIASGPGGTPGPDFCYKNMKIENGSDTFEEMTSELFATTPQDGQCYNFIDFDNDQDLDLCLTNYGGVSTRFYQNNNGTYSLITTPFSTQTTNLANNWGDFDNDGDLDVIITNDNARPRFYKNNNGTFAAAITIGTVNNSSGLTNGDYDNDGDLDIFVSGVDATRALYKNTSAATGNNWITIKCNGTISNKSALGTIVKIRATINGIDTWQMREINAQNSFQSQNDLRVHFGLGNATTVQSLILQYPSGIIETFSNVSPNSFYSNTENSGNLLSLNTHNANQTELMLFPNPTKNILTLQFNSELENQKIQLSILNSEGKTIQKINQKIFQNKIDITTSSLPNGVYYIKLEIDSHYYHSKFIKH